MDDLRQIEVKKQIEDTFKESGIILEYDEIGDADLSGYLEDSIHFISMVVSLEEKLGIEFPDELLILEAFHSLNALSTALADQTPLEK